MQVWLLRSFLFVPAPFLHASAGFFAGAAATAVTMPADVVKTRIQTAVGAGQAHRGVLSTAVSIYRNEGPGALMRGLLPRLLYLGPAGAISFTSYEALKGLLRIS